MDDQCRIMPKVTSWEGISVDAPDILPVASPLSNASSHGKFFPSFPLFLLSSLVLYCTSTVQSENAVWCFPIEGTFAP